MSAGKNPYHRYYILNACFINRQKPEWTKQELIRKLEDNDFQVSSRTIDNDLNAMRYDERLRFFAPIKFCRKSYTYSYTDPDYSIDKLQLSDEQLRAFEGIVHLMRPYKGTQIVKEFEGAMEKIVRGVDQLRRERLSHADPTIAVEEAPYYKGHMYLDAFKNAIDLKQPLSIQYQKFGSEKPDRHVFHPYFLKEYEGRWYVLGYSERRHFIITLGLDRVEHVDPLDKPYRENKAIRPSDFFRDTVGITYTSGPVEDIVVWFAPATAPYIKTRHLHHSQEVMEDTADGLTIKLRLRVNFELLSLLLRYVPNVAVVAPASLRKKFGALLEEGVKRNGK